MSIENDIKNKLKNTFCSDSDYLSFEAITNDNCLNSTFKDENFHCTDFNGVFSNNRSGYKQIENDFLITKTPSLTSKGFDNTFKLLEKQIAENRRKSTKLMQSLYDQNLYCGILCETSLSDLQLFTLYRIISLLSFYVSAIDNDPISLEYVLKSLITTEYSSELLDISLLQIKLDANTDFTNNILYFVSKAKDGRNHLKILRSLKMNKVLCGNRVSQMTRTYEDIEAITRLLEEKEKDLELTIQIGKELLAQNNTLENKIIILEGELRACNDDRAQLLHELQKKNELIAVLTNDLDESYEHETPTFSKSINMDVLQNKISFLQNENEVLKNEVRQLACQTDEVEEQERKLMTDITSQLHIVNDQYDDLNLEIERQREENRIQHEQIVNLTARLKEAEMRLHSITTDNEEHISLLNITKENQNCLAFELMEFKQRYQEVLSLFQEAQEQLRKYRKKLIRSDHNTTKGLLQPESLHSELMESSIYSENSFDSGIYGSGHRNNELFIKQQNVNPFYNDGSDLPTVNMFSSCKQVFDTVRCANKNGIYSQSGKILKSQLVTTSMTSSAIPRMSSMTYLNDSLANDSTIEPCIYNNSSYGNTNIFERTISFDSLSSQSRFEYPSQPTGVPGAPGAKDLEEALKRLTPAEILARRARLSFAPIGTYTNVESATMTGQLGNRTPDSILSTGSSGLSSSTNMFSSLTQWRLPEKLQIVKPLEGSQTLNHWSRLATPTLSGLLEERPGVTIRGGRGLESLGIQVYTLSDVEEDTIENSPGKQFETSGCIYTYITSTVMHPDDGILNDSSFLTQSQVSSRVVSASTSRQPSCPPTPKTGLSRRNSCTTFSVNIGLATLLNERGIKAVTPSALNTPVGTNFSPTVTPCNSPEGSPTRSVTPEPLVGTSISGTDLINKNKKATCYNQKHIILSRLEKRALRSLKLVEKVESIGLENIISTQPSAMYQAVTSGIANRSGKCIKSSKLNLNPNDMEDHIHFNREYIKEVLTRDIIPYENNKDGSLISIIKNCTNKYHPQANQSLSTQHEKQIYRLKSRRNMKNGISIQRPDLGTINYVRNDLGKVYGQNSQKFEPKYETKNIQKENKKIDCCEPQTITQSFVGSVSSLLFGRKGGWL